MRPAIRREQVTAVTEQVEQGREPIAAAAKPSRRRAVVPRRGERFSMDADRRVRFRGQGRRGRRTHSSEDAGDVLQAERELGVARQMIVQASLLTGRDAKELRAAALARIGLASRWIDELLEKRGAP